MSPNLSQSLARLKAGPAKLKPAAEQARLPVSQIVTSHVNKQVIRQHGVYHRKVRILKCIMQRFDVIIICVIISNGCAHVLEVFVHNYV